MALIPTSSRRSRYRVALARQLCSCAPLHIYAYAQENIVTMAQQQAKIARIEQEIQEAQAGQCLDSVPASTEEEFAGQITQAAAQAAALSESQQKHLQNHLCAHSPSAAAQTPVRSEHNSQPRLSQVSVQKTDASDNARDGAAHQSMWL